MNETNSDLAILQDGATLVEVNQVLLELITGDTSILSGEKITPNQFEELVDYLQDTVQLVLKTNVDRSVVAILADQYFQTDRSFAFQTNYASTDRCANIPATSYASPETESVTSTPSCYSELVETDYSLDPSIESYSDKIIKARNKISRKLTKIEFHPQKSPEWHAQRLECLTATAVAVALGESPYTNPYTLLCQKSGREAPFVQNSAVHHGRKYEEIGTLFYQTRKNVKVIEYGLIQHPEFPFIGASPDGICCQSRWDERGLSNLTGRMLEIKFPYMRKILDSGNLDGDICPHYYYLQMQTQMWVTGLDECDFLQCKLTEYDTYQNYLDDTHPILPGLSKETGLERGPIIQLISRKDAARMLRPTPEEEEKEKERVEQGNEKEKLQWYSEYIYPPRLHMSMSEIDSWISKEIVNFSNNPLSKDYYFDKVIWWRLEKVRVDLVKADKKWRKKSFPILEQFWEYVVTCRENPKLLVKFDKLLANIDPHDMKKVFEIVHRECSKKQKDLQEKEPLFQEESKWRSYSTSKQRSKAAWAAKKAASKKN